MPPKRKYEEDESEHGPSETHKHAKAEESTDKVLSCYLAVVNRSHGVCVCSERISTPVPTDKTRCGACHLLFRLVTWLFIYVADPQLCHPRRQ